MKVLVWILIDMDGHNTIVKTKLSNMLAFEGTACGISMDFD
jgi:hypothetical protein